MKVNLYDLKSQKIDQVSLKKEVFDSKINQDLLSQAVRVYLFNQRKAHPLAKGRSQVAGSTRKIWAQKGTGRARHSDMRAPIFVGGGVAHGPKGNQNYHLKLNKKMAKLAVRSALSQFAKDSHILAVSDLEKIKIKTKQALDLINSLKKIDKNLSSSKKIALIINSDNKNAKQAFKNLSDIDLLYTNSLNTYQLLNHNFLIFSQNSLDFVNKNK